MNENYFEKLAKINVNDHVEKKGKFSYLSWAWAVDVLRKEDPTATWEVIRFNGMPFMETKYGIFVEVSVTVQGITLSQIHPVLDNNNKPIEKPNSFQINTSIQRALVKAIALHGLGLYIYAGEDLPETDDGNAASQAPQSSYTRPASVPTQSTNQQTQQPTTQPVTSSNAPVKLATDGQVKLLAIKRKAAGFEGMEEINAHLGINIESLTELPMSKVNDLIKFLDECKQSA